MTEDDSCIEDGLAESFAEDFKDHLYKLENDILALDQNTEAIDSIFRIIHSIKGSAGMLGFKQLSSLAHAMENILSRLRNGVCLPDSELKDLLLEGVDSLKKLFADLKNSNRIDLSKIHLQLDQFIAALDVDQTAKIDPPLHHSCINNFDINSEGTKRILIIEDHLVNQRFLEEAIKSSGGNFEIVTVDSGATGLFHFFTEQFDLVFVDIMMPNIDGSTFIAIVEENLKKGRLLKRPNIIVQTALQSIGRLSVLSQNDCVQEILRKPVKKEKVLEVVLRYCYMQNSVLSKNPNFI